jgi:hypothetical protein
VNGHFLTSAKLMMVAAKQLGLFSVLQLGLRIGFDWKIVGSAVKIMNWIP